MSLLKNTCSHTSKRALCDACFGDALKAVEAKTVHLKDAEITRLKRIITKELADNDDLGAEFIYVNALKEQLAIATEALENCTGGDLASGEGIYKAEIAREALAKLKGSGL